MIAEIPAALAAALPLLMFLFALALIFMGFPVAFSLGGAALIFAVIGVSLEIFPWSRMGASTNRIFGIMKNEVLLAVPFFIFMGTMLEKSRLAEDLLKTVGQLFGPVPGGIGLAVVFVGALLGAATGVVGASVVAMGMISLPIMLRYGYDKKLATGVIAASGTLGQIIPPSVVLIVLASQLNVEIHDSSKAVSVGDLFRGALTPGLLLAGLFALYVGVTAILNPKKAPAIPKEDRATDKRDLLKKTLLVLLPPIVLIIIVLGSIFAGIATPTEAGALGGVGAMLLALISKRFTKLAIIDTMRTTLRLSSMVMFLLIGSTVFVVVFKFGFHGDRFIKDILTQLPGGFIGALIVTNLIIFLLGFFIDFFEICFIVVPLVAPVFINHPEWDVHPAWFGVMIAMNLQMSFLTPPFGFSLFYLKGTCPPEIKTTDIYKGVMPFIIIQALALLAVIIWPEIVTWMV
ncbi:MAG: tripartite ATP-independent transporter DctM subunit [Verrucomicrobiales bacterium]|jgi:tripartite ATP-independent transporter DctM subunit